MNCKFCHSTENLYTNGINTFTKKPQFVCRKCNTEHCRKYRQTKKGKEAVKRAVKKYEFSHPERKKAWALIANNHLPKEVCLRCGIDKVHAHHPDVTDPLRIVFLCPLHHKQQHMLKLDQ